MKANQGSPPARTVASVHKIYGGLNGLCCTLSVSDNLENMCTVCVVRWPVRILECSCLDGAVFSLGHDIETDTYSQKQHDNDDHRPNAARRKHMNGLVHAVSTNLFVLCVSIGQMFGSNGRDEGQV